MTRNNATGRQYGERRQGNNPPPTSSPAPEGCPERLGQFPGTAQHTADGERRNQPNGSDRPQNSGGSGGALAHSLQLI
jgi:hypothetical protein